MRRRIWRWLPWALALLLAAGGVWRCEMLKPKAAEVIWVAEFPGELLSPQVQLLPDGGVVAGGWRATAWVDSEGGIEEFIPVPPNAGRSAERSQSNHLDAAGNCYFTIWDNVYSYDPVGNLRWQVTLQPLVAPLQGKLSKGSVSRVSPAGHVLVISQITGLSVLDTDGQILSQPSLPFNPALVAPLELPDGRFAVGVPTTHRGPTEVVLLDSDGTELWHQSLPGGRLRQLEAYAGGILIQDMEGQTWLLDCAGEVLWHYQPPHAQQKNAATNNARTIVMADGALLLCSPSEVVRIDSTGDVRWRYNSTGLTGIAQLHGDECYVIAYDDDPPKSVTRTLMMFSQKVAQGYYEKLHNPRMLKLEHGFLTGQWRLPFLPATIHGPSPEGEVYICSLLDDKLYCVKPE